MRACLKGLLNSSDPIEDIAQEVSIRAWKGIRARGPPERLDGWLWGIARHVVDDYKKSRALERLRRATYSPATERPENPLDRTCQNESRKGIRDAIDELPDLERLLVRERAEGRSVTELSENVGDTYAAVKTRLYRARRTLQKKLRHLPSFKEDRKGGG